MQLRFSLYWSTWWKTTKRIHKKSLSSNQICTNLNCMGFLQLWLIWIWRVICMCVCESKRVLAIKWRSSLFKDGATPHSDRKDTASSRTHMHTPVLEILQYTGQGKQNTPPSTSTHTHHVLAGICCLIHHISDLPLSPKLGLFSQITVQTDTVVSTFPREEW